MTYHLNSGIISSDTFRMDLAKIDNNCTSKDSAGQTGQRGNRFSYVDLANILTQSFTGPWNRGPFDWWDGKNSDILTLLF